MLDKPCFFVFFGCVCFLCVSCFVFKVNVNICGRITSEIFSFFTFFSPHRVFLTFKLIFCNYYSSLKLLPIVCLILLLISFKWFKILHLASLVSLSRSLSFRLFSLSHVFSSLFALSKSVLVDSL